MTDTRHRLNVWVEAMRLRTLPVSVAGVVMAIGYAVADHVFQAAPAILCLIFAIMAQIASNFANEYYDYRDGLDKAGRDGPRRGVTEGDITPRAMLVATLALLGAACAIGLSLLFWGPWWLVPVGILIALGVMAYSTGPYPLSRHGLGEVAVILFFGVIPVNLTYYLQSGIFTADVAWGSLAIGLMGANVLLVNNYRDADDDAAVGKRTLAVMGGRRLALAMYLADGVAAFAILLTTQSWFAIGCWLYLAIHLTLWNFIRTHLGKPLNPMLGLTALTMLAMAIAFTISASI